MKDARAIGPRIALRHAKGLEAATRDEEENDMSSKRVRCTVVEVPVGSNGEPQLDLATKDLLPWADPYIAKLLSRHRPRAALDDSLQFVEDEVAGRDSVAWERFQGGVPPSSSPGWTSYFD